MKEKIISILKGHLIAAPCADGSSLDVIHESEIEAIANELCNSMQGSKIQSELLCWHDGKYIDGNFITLSGQTTYKDECGIERCNKCKRPINKQSKQ